MSKKIESKWLCIQRYYDNGRVTAIVVPKTGDVRPFESCPKFDYYVDEFDTKKEADQFAADALKA